jgi:Shedu protein SduA, C-terminal
MVGRQVMVMSENPHDRDGEYAAARVAGRIYISGRFPYRGDHPDDPLNGVVARFGYTVQDAAADFEVTEGKGLDLIIRETPTRQQLKALFLEDAKVIQALFFQRFTPDGCRISRECFTLRGDELDQVLGFLDLIRSAEATFAGPDSIRYSPALIRQMAADSSAVAQLVRQHPDLLEEIMRSEVSAPDVVALARRRQVLREFGDMLTDPSAFAVVRARSGGPERAWQRFFEDHPWIVGGSLAPQFLHSLDRARLQQAVRGTSVSGAGKSADAMLKTAGALSAMVLVEIKHHQTSLLGSQYRPDCWRISDEVAGGVAQCQVTASWAEKDLGPSLDVRDQDGYTADRVEVCRPRSILVVGSLGQFVRDGRLNRPMFESFERFRRSLREPEIVTFDELHQRASTILALADDGESEQPPTTTTIEESEDWTNPPF